MKIKSTLLLPAVVLLLASCSSSKQQMTYFKDIDTLEEVVVGDYSVVIEPSDELYISVTSYNPEATSAYNLPYTNPAVRHSIIKPTSSQQLTYTVDSNGDITFPVLGVIHVAGLTVEQLKAKLTKEIGETVDDPLVTVQLVSFYVNVAGEVLQPGRVEVTSPRFSILDALSQVGDLTQYGRRDNVLLVREENGKRIHVRFDLTSSDMLNSPYFFLKQNDYIYVEPNDVRKDNAEYSQYNSYKLSVVSTIVSGAASIISLIIALSR